MKRIWHAMVCGTALLAALSGCSAAQSSTATGQATSAPAPADVSAVPTGVAQEYGTLQEEIAAEGGEITSGDWQVGYIVEGAEPWFETRSGKQVFRPVAAVETHHLEIIPREAATGRIVPNTSVRLEVLDGAGKVVQGKSLTQYYGEFFHYAENFAVAQPGRYTLRATIDAPALRRHGEENEKPALSDGVTVEFKDVELAPA